MSGFCSEILAAIRSVVGTAGEPVLLHRPYLPPSAWDYARECLHTGWVSSAGSYVSEFEAELARYTGSARAIATVNGTAALEMCFRLAGVQPGDEVICPSLTFVATANAISHCGAVPHFVDVTERRLSVSPQALAERLDEVVGPGTDGPINRMTNRRISAVCLMHCFGHPGEIEPIVRICEQYHLPLIEDAAESLGSFYQGKHTGRYGLLSALSFNGNKILTTGGGGAILTDNEALADRAKHLTTTAKVPHAWEFIHDAIGWNYRLPNLNAALGVAQLEVLPQILHAKRQVAENYLAAFSGIDGIEFLTEPEDSQSNYWLNCILLSRDHEASRDVILNALHQAGIQCRPLWQPMHLLPVYEGCPRGAMNVTEALSRRAINIPSSADLAPGWTGVVS